MKKNITTVILALVFGSSVMLADEADEKTFTGKIACAKCTVSKSKRCGAAFVLTDEDGKKEVLLIKGKGSTSIPHRLYCRRGTYLEVTLTGVRESLGTDTIMSSKVELLKK